MCAGVMDGVCGGMKRGARDNLTLRSTNQKRIGKRIGNRAKNESDDARRNRKKAQICAGFVKSLDNPFNLLYHTHCQDRQNTKQKDKT